jgi:hypothetical protein
MPLLPPVLPQRLQLLLLTYKHIPTAYWARITTPHNPQWIHIWYENSTADADLIGVAL